MFYILLFLAAFTYSSGQPEWAYDGPTGVDNWSVLYPNDCSLRSQSPITIDPYLTIYDSNLGSIVFEGYDQALNNYKIENTGRTVELLLNSGATRPRISGGGLPGTYELENIHFHWASRNYNGSEHRIVGFKYAMECHIVHRNEKYANMNEALQNEDGIAVLAVFFKQARQCASSTMVGIANALKHIRYAETETKLNLTESIASLLPRKSHFYRYMGSLTTPNCTEAVIWTVFPTPKEIGERELNEFRSVYETAEGEGDIPLVNNIRPVQDLNGRRVYRNFFFIY